MKFLRPLISLTLGLSILFSLGGISIYKHYCGDFLAAFSIYTPADDCSEDGEEDCESKKSSCCHDQMDYYAADLDVIKQEHKSFQLVPNFFKAHNEKSSIQMEPLPQKCAQQLIPKIHAPPIYIVNSQLTYYG